jgi:hypothetical protein
VALKYEWQQTVTGAATCRIGLGLTDRQIEGLKGVLQLCLSERRLIAKVGFVTDIAVLN